MKAQPLKLIHAKGYFRCATDEATHVRLQMPGPIPLRFIPVILRGSRDETGCWTWNGDTEKPTLRPSILTTNGEGRDRCHTWVSDGEAQFLADCSHELAGKTVPLLDVPIDNYTEETVICDGCKKEHALRDCVDSLGFTICPDCWIGEQP